MLAALRHRRLGVDVIAVLALAGAPAVREYLAAAVISVMVVSGGLWRGGWSGELTVTAGLAAAGAAHGPPL